MRCVRGGRESRPAPELRAAARTSPMPEPRSVLVVVTQQIGDVLLTTR